MKRRVLELLLGKIKIPGPGDQFLTITRIADFSNVPKGVEEVRDYVNHYLKIQIPSDIEIIFPLQRKIIATKYGDIVGQIMEKVEFHSIAIENLITALKNSLKTDPEDKFSWGSLTSIPDWVWINIVNSIWFRLVRVVTRGYYRSSCRPLVMCSLDPLGPSGHSGQTPGYPP